MGQRQVGAGPPGPGTEVLLALATVGAGGVVLTLALQAALAHRAQVGVQVALAPMGTQGQRRQHLWAVGWVPEGRAWEGVGAGLEGTQEVPSPACHSPPPGQKNPLSPSHQGNPISVLSPGLAAAGLLSSLIMVSRVSYISVGGGAVTRCPCPRCCISSNAASDHLCS